LSIKYIKLVRETRKNRQLQLQIDKYSEALNRSVYNYSLIRHHFQLISNSNLALSQELQKAKVIVKTLEAVIQMLYISSLNKFGRTDSTLSNEQPTS
jgi:ABC-type phosphate transport system auxiliary subunit